MTGQTAATGEADMLASLGPLPRISMQAFCETPEISRLIETASKDRRMTKTHVKVHMGGVMAAANYYHSAPTPNLIIVESMKQRVDLMAELDSLAEVCDAGTKVIVIGHVNDVELYRDLIRSGVSEYLVAPLQLFDLIRAVGDLYHNPEASPLGRVVAFVGAKGGCGASTVAHNVAWSIARQFESEVVLADMDLPFGTAGLDFNQDPVQGIAEAVQSPERLDEVYLDRLLSKCAEHLSLLAAPATLDRPYDFDEKSFDGLLDVMRGSIPTAILDVPHVWTRWSRQVLRSADEIVVVAAPDLANLRNAKNIVDFLKNARPNDAAPRLVLNQVGMPKRPEIRGEEFMRALDTDILAEIPFDIPLFGGAANNGQMISEVDPKNPVGATFDTIAQVITGRGEARRQKKSALAPLLERFRAKKSA
ncbi:MAG: CtpF protein [Hyphomicrobiales bacterium]|nr:MAG: CtpF protein [Hyphomicrobiales bacterium]